jgi:hypothetical protein
MLLETSGMAKKFCSRQRLGLCFVLGMLLPAIVVGSVKARDIEEPVGPWELSLQGSHRRCRITLAEEEAPSRRFLRFPAGCRRALPILNTIGGWSLDGATLRLLNPDTRPILDFGPRPGEEGFIAVSEVGEHYILEIGERHPIAVVEPVSLQSPSLPPLPEAPGPPPIGVPQVTPVDPATAPRPETLPGLYAVDRYFEREVCRVELRAVRLGDATARHEARLQGRCRDPGLATFDPIGWRYEKGRLTLVARRGHEVTLISERSGQWRRDPEVGATLVLRRTEQ